MLAGIVAAAWQWLVSPLSLGSCCFYGYRFLKSKKRLLKEARARVEGRLNEVLLKEREAAWELELLQKRREEDSPPTVEEDLLTARVREQKELARFYNFLLLSINEGLDRKTLTEMIRTAKAGVENVRDVHSLVGALVNAGRERRRQMRGLEQMNLYIEGKESLSLKQEG